MLRFDSVHVDLSRAVTTPEGWIRDKPVLTRAGVFAYRKADGSVRREMRPAEWVFEEGHLASLHGAPITIDHPAGGKLVTADHAPVTIGAGIGPGERQDNEMPGPLVIHNPKAMGQRRELSLGYSITRLDETPGKTESGEPYDAIQVGPYRINHIAVVPRGRAGTSRLRLDAADAVLDTLDNQEDPIMPDGKTMPVRLDSGISYDAPPEVAAAFDKLRHDMAAAATSARAEIDAVKVRADQADAARDAEKSRADAAEAKLPTIAAEAVVAARARLALEATAKHHGAEVRADAADRDVRIAVIAKLAPGADLSGKSDAYVDARFDSEIERVTTKAANGAAQAASAAPTATVRADAVDAPKVARSAADVHRALVNAGLA